MKIIVLGAGVVGISITRYLVSEGHDVVMVDNRKEALAFANEQLDIQTIEGVGSHPHIMAQAGADKADMLIAVTPHDEVNMVACQMAYSIYKIPVKMMRVHEASYLSLVNSYVYTPDNMPVDVIISPEREVVESIMRTISVPGANDAAPLAGGKLMRISANVLPGSPLVGEHIATLSQNLGATFHIMALYRKHRLIIPQKTDHLEVGDEVHFLCAPENVTDSMTLFGFTDHLARQAMILGGGNIGSILCEQLEQSGFATRIIEKVEERSEDLADILSKTTVLRGNVLDRDLLVQENIAKMGVVLAVTSDDAANILSSILAKQLGAQNVMTLVTHADSIPLAESLGIDRVICPQEITASRILQHIRKGNIQTLHTIHVDEAEVLEFTVMEESPLLGLNVQGVSLPANTRIAATLHNGTVYPYQTNPIIHAGDTLIVFSAMESISALERLME